MFDPLDFKELEMQNAKNVNMVAESIMYKISQRAFGEHDSLNSDAYHEEGDALAQLRSNVEELSELHQRLRFMMREVSYLIKRH